MGHPVPRAHGSQDVEVLGSVEARDGLQLGGLGPQPRDVLRLGPPDRSPRTAGTPAPRRPAARSPGSLASDGGDPSPATSCGSHYSLTLTSLPPAPVARLAPRLLHQAEIREHHAP